MKDIEYIIEYENEHTRLDFKRDQYTKQKHDEFLKDVIAMANAIGEGEKLIIIGVKHSPNGEREIHPIQDSEFVDDATYQQIVRENIEPDLHISYKPFRHKDQLLGIFHLTNCNNPPYLLKKDYGKLKKGDCFIRKGSHKTPISRSDLDKIYEIKNKNSKFVGVIDIGFSETHFSQEITISTVNRDDLPSEKAAEKIRQILTVKKQEQEQRLREKKELESKQRIAYPNIDISNLVQIHSPFGNIPYEERSILTLEKNLKEVKETYQKDDIYEIFEVRSFRLNFEIFNNSDEYLQDASVRIEIPKKEDYIIAKEIMRKSEHNPLEIQMPIVNTPFGRCYPKVEFLEDKILIQENIGDIKHQMTTEAFDYGVRLVVIEIPENGIIPIDFKLFGKNLPQPIHKKLTIHVAT